MNLRQQKYKHLIHFIVFHLTLSYIKKLLKKNLVGFYISYILKNMIDILIIIYHLFRNT